MALPASNSSHGDCDLLELIIDIFERGVFQAADSSLQLMLWSEELHRFSGS